MPTKIEWTDETWNPVTGCTKISAGCANCYAERMARRLAGRYGYPEAPRHFDVTLHPEHLDKPLRWRKPRQVFVCSMGDLFHEDVPDTFIAQVWRVMCLAPEHIFQVLTKRPHRMLERFSKFAEEALLPNVWLGVSCENQAAADERIPLLLQTPAAVRFVSLEPLLGPIDLDRILPIDEDGNRLLGMDWSDYISWVIVGGESGPGARPMHPDWARSLRDQAQVAGVPFFFKQWGAWIVGACDGTGKLRNHGHFCADGKWITRSRQPGTAVFMSRVGKKCAGRLLDGREWNEMPAVRAQ